MLSLQNSGKRQRKGNPNFLRDVKHGRDHEKSALRGAEKCIGEPIERGQVFRDINGKLVKPDGMVNGRPVEVKNVAPRTANRGKDIRQLAEENKRFKLQNVNGELRVNKKHQDYKQVQQQIDVAQATSGYLGVHVNDGHGMVDDEVVRVSRHQSIIDKMNKR